MSGHQIRKSMWETDGYIIHNLNTKTKHYSLSALLKLLHTCPYFWLTAGAFECADVCPMDCMDWECCVGEVLEPTPKSGDETDAYVSDWDFHSVIDVMLNKYSHNN